MKLILARHGNTFAPQDKVVWVGSANDLPLVESGMAQAKRLADALAHTKLAAIYCAPLLRTKRMAQEVAAAQMQPLTPIIDNRLTELDYGDWSGLSDSEIIERFGEAALTNWVERSIWPEDCHWGASEAKVCEEVQDFVLALSSKHDKDDTVLVVSSNGRLRYFLKLVEGEFARRLASKSFKMGTGRVSMLTGKSALPAGTAGNDGSGQGADYSLSFWNEQPDTLLKAFSGATSL